MPRRRPGAVRAAQARARHHAVIPGLSPSTCRTLNRLDRDELRPDAVAAALRRWQQAARDPAATARRRLGATGPRFEPPSWREGQPTWQDEAEDQGCPVCAAAERRRRGVVPNARQVLRWALYALPRGQARQLRRLVHEADRRVLDKTLPAPARPRDEPWWRGRIIA